jgi:hypothetical protein
MNELPEVGLFHRLVVRLVNAGRNLYHGLTIRPASHKIPITTKNMRIQATLFNMRNVQGARLNLKAGLNADDGSSGW